MIRVTLGLPLDRLAFVQEPADRPWLARVLDHFAAEPALFELLLLGIVVGLGLFAFGYLGRKVRDARSKSAIEDYLLGIEQACAGEHAGAAKRLTRVLEQDPENLQARLVLGEVLRELGRPVEAHSQHLQLQKAFGVTWPRNDLALARCLLDVPNHASEAVDPARRAAKALPKDLGALRLVFEAELAAGLAEAAAASADRLARLLPPGPERQEVLAKAARALAALAERQRVAGGLGEAGAALARAKTLAPEVPEVLLLEARLRLQDGGPVDLSRILPGTPGKATDHALALLDAPGAALAVRGDHAAVGSHLLALQRWTPQERHAELDRELENPELVLDEVEENRAHVRRTIERAAAGAKEAEDELVQLRETALDELLVSAIAEGASAAVSARCITLMGAGIVPALFASYARLRERRAFPFAELLIGTGAAAVGRIAQGFGREALPAFTALLTGQDRELRKIAVDYHIALADPGAFAAVLEALPPVEIIHRLNATKPEVLRTFLASVEDRSSLSELLLVDPAFHRDEELVHAIPFARTPTAIVGILKRRGYDGDLAEALLDHLGDAVHDPALWSVLDSYGARAFDHIVSAFADLDRAPAVRAQVRASLRSQGAAVVPALCECFGSTASALDAELVALLVEIGVPGVPALDAAYGQSSWMERVTATFVGRDTHRRVMILRTLTAIPGSEAEATLRRLQGRESDANLQLRIAEALRRRSS